MKRSILKKSPCIVLLLCGCAAFSAMAAEYPARLDTAEKHIVSVAVEGLVSKVMVKPGDRVSKDQTLISLDTQPFQIKVDEKKARVAALKSAFQDAKRENDQAQSLYEQTVLSDVELQRIQIAYRIAGAELNEARAQLKLVQWELDNAVQRAPWSGWVLNSAVHSGQVIVGDVRSRPLIVLGRDGKLSATALIPPVVAAKLKLGEKLTIKVGAKKYSAEIRSLQAQDMAEAGNIVVQLSVIFDAGGEISANSSQPAVIHVP